MNVGAIRNEPLQMQWYLDADNCWVYRIGRAWVWIQARPPYCDRGHWWANVEGIRSIDDADSFPRYFMNLDLAKIEMSEWLRWRFDREART